MVVPSSAACAGVVMDSADANAARRRLWHLLLEGDRGCIVWWSEDCIDWKSDDYALTARAKARAMSSLKKSCTP